ncbi:uncharacterized protein Hap1MRO34_023259 [Clarias gariepinus]|uniref:uncharacterized protein LOC128509147 n=1 Tax=Clarias gariepinus TaxID=13013 RepID=UPI00234C8E06|nr:uncharacterized protein LOC128509147 [Clarias gariepinus]
MSLTDGAALRSLLYAAGTAAAAYGLYYYISTMSTEDPVQRVSETISSIEDALQDQDIEACSGLDRKLISEFKSLKNTYERMLEYEERCERELFTAQSLEREKSHLNSMFVSLREREHQLNNQITQNHMMYDNEIREKMQKKQEVLNFEDKVKLRVEPIAKLYEKENETHKTLKEYYEKVMESNIQQELERTELQNQLYALHGLVQQLKEQNCEADE